MKINKRWRNLAVVNQPMAIVNGVMKLSIEMKAEKRMAAASVA